MKNLGEVEDGEYDWMKLNNGKGWEVISKHPSPNQYHHHSQGPHVSGAADNRGQNTNSRGQSQAQLTAGRLNAPQPLPPSPAKKRERPNVPNTQQPKRPSGTAGGLQPRASTPTASTQAQFQPSQTNLPQARVQSSQAAMNQQSPPTPRNQDTKRTTWQKIQSALCCGMW